jgi:hypothetical protein
MADATFPGMYKTWLHAFALDLLLIHIAAKLRHAFESHVPVGYQDENGFHYGIQKAK